MGTRATRTLTSLAFSCLRRQLHSALGSGKQLPVSPWSSAILSSPSATSSNLQGRIDGGQHQHEYEQEEEEELWHIKMMPLDPRVSSFDRAHKLSREDLIARLLQNTAPSQDRSADEWSVDVLSGRFSRGLQHSSGERITEGHSKEAGGFRDQDFLSRYLQWRSYDRSSRSPESRNYSDVLVAAENAVGIYGIISLSRQNFESGSIPRLPQSCSSLNFYQEPSMIIPLEADSVKRKRKKKMNKHKQRKLRRRDRHRK